MAFILLLLKNVTGEDLTVINVNCNIAPNGFECLLYKFRHSSHENIEHGI